MQKGQLFLVLLVIMILEPVMSVTYNEYLKRDTQCAKDNDVLNCKINPLDFNSYTTASKKPSDECPL